jgi:hypothetical protein
MMLSVVMLLAPLVVEVSTVTDFFTLERVYFYYPLTYIAGKNRASCCKSLIYKTPPKPYVIELFTKTWVICAKSLTPD